MTLALVMLIKCLSDLVGSSGVLEGVAQAHLICEVLVESVSLAFVGSTLFLPVSTKKVLSYCSNGIGAIIYMG